MSRASIFLTALGLALISSVGHAQAPMSFVPKGPAISAAQSTQKPLSLSTSGLLPLGYAQRAPAQLPAGIARTSVEHSADALTGSAGLLCGLQPSADTSGAATARGYDPDGKFVGAKLALRF